MIPPPDDRTLIDDLLAGQRRLTAVEKFAQMHDQHSPAVTRYTDLLPASPPAPGQQYAFEVDLDQCSGCKACVTACHSLNGLDDGESWRDIGGLVGEDWRQPFTQTVTTACHHCEDPGCLNGCPVLAYEKDAVTGIVRHLDDQCIGCQYCVLKCPYEVPKYSEARGIVRKCDMCSQRLKVGEAPACVQACPNEAIRITVVPTNRSASPAADGAFAGGGEITTSPSASLSATVPAFAFPSPDSAITKPTTRYRSKRGLPERLAPAATSASMLQPAHWPLVWMLVLTQMGVGVFVVLAVMPPEVQSAASLAGSLITLTGLAASAFHLGRPLKAWRAFLGWRRSWMSREIIAFGAFAPWVMATAFILNAPPSWQATLRLDGIPGLATGLMAASAIVGLASVVCSGMIYHDTRRTCWRGIRSIGRFVTTAGLLGIAVLWLFCSMENQSVRWLPLSLIAMTIAKLVGEQRALRHGEADVADQAWPVDHNVDSWVLARAARLRFGELGVITRTGTAALLLGGIFVPLLAFLPEVSPSVLPAVALCCCFGAEVADRYLFFRAVVFPRMPGL